MSSFYNNILLTNVYLQPVQFVLGIVTNTLSIRIFCSRAFRSSACTQYFLAYAIFNIMYVSLSCPTQFLRSFRIDWASNIISCKIFYYFIYTPPIIARFMLVLATFDRFCSSSSSLRLRSISTLIKSRIIIITTTTLISFYMCSTFVIYYWNETSQICLPCTDRISSIFFFSQMLLYYILGPVLIFIFGGLTVYNIRKHKVHVQTNRRTEGQLARMLLAQITIHIILTVPFGVVYCMNLIDSSTRTLNILAIRYLFVIWYQCDYFISFFLHVLSGQVYREQCLKIFHCKKRQIYPR